MIHLHITNRRKGGLLRWIPRLVFLAVVAVAQLGAAGGVAAYLHFSADLPPVPTPEAWRPSIVSTFHGHDGRLLGEFTIERRVPVPLERMPRHLVEAFLAAEDGRFFEHKGVDYRSTARALIQNYRAGRTVSGASTITQQLCKTRVGNERSYRRKAKEAILARRTEATLGKLEILYLYLNEIYLGHGAYGVQAAAQNYFRKDVWQLSVAESAILAGLPPRPSSLNPVKTFDKAKERQAYVLGRMVHEGFLTAAEAEAAKAEPLRVYKRLLNVAEEATPYFTEHVRREVLQRYGYDALHKEGLRVFMAVDADFQRKAQDALREGLHDLGERQGYLGPVAQLDAAKAKAFVKSSTAHYQGPEALIADRYYLGLVKAVERSGAEVRVGALEARLPLKHGLHWAVPYDLEAEKNRGRIKDATKALSVGDVIIVRLNRASRFADSEVPVLALAQEPALQGALLSMDPRTGYVLAMIGGYDFDQSEYNRAFQGCRQPGSIFKPLVYSLALNGEHTLASLINDTPITVYDRQRTFIWKPKNYAGKYKGDVLLRNAFIHSMNIPAIRVITSIGPKAAANWAEHLGITTPMHPDQSLVLGSSCVYPWDMAKVYATFALRGRVPRTAFIKRVEDRDGRVLEDRTHFSDPWAPVGSRLDGMLRLLFEPRDRKIPEDTAFLVQTALEQVARSGTAAKARKLGLPVGGKTGTTDAYDAWFVGFSESLVSAVWVGSDRNERRLGKKETGGAVALPVWMDFMKYAHDGAPPRPLTEDPPESIVFAKVDTDSGLLAPKGNRALELPFRSGTEPTEVATRAGSFDDRDLDSVEGRF